MWRGLDPEDRGWGRHSGCEAQRRAFLGSEAVKPQFASCTDITLAASLVALVSHILWATASAYDGL